VSCQGTKSEDGAVEKAGPIHDAAFFDCFFSEVDGALGTPQDAPR
jgi:hypothetical protein